MMWHAAVNKSLEEESLMPDIIVSHLAWCHLACRGPYFAPATSAAGAGPAAEESRPSSASPGFCGPPCVQEDCPEDVQGELRTDAVKPRTGRRPPHKGSHLIETWEKGRADLAKKWLHFTSQLHWARRNYNHQEQIINLVHFINCWFLCTTH